MSWNDGIWAIVPTICVGLIFWFVMRGIFHADRNERAAMAKIEAEESAARERQLPQARVEGGPSGPRLETRATD